MLFNSEEGGDLIDVEESFPKQEFAVYSSTLSAPELQKFLEACDIVLPRPLTKDVYTWLESLRKQAATMDATLTVKSKRRFSWPQSLLVSSLGFAVFFLLGYFVIITPDPALSLTYTLYLSIGIFLGLLGIAQNQAETASTGGILTKSLAWYLAPSLTNLDQAQRFFLSVSLAACLEYPFLTFANARGFKNKTGMRLRAFQDFMDILLSFVLIAVAGTGVVDAFSISQNFLALLRVLVAFWGPRWFPSPYKQRDSALQVIRSSLFSIETPGSVVECFRPWVKQNKRVGQVLCLFCALLGVMLGLVGMFVTVEDAYLLGIAAVLGMSLAWYVGPSLRHQRFWVKWAVSVLFLATLEFPFLSEANFRAALTKTVYQLRAVQDVCAMVVSTVLIAVLSHIRLTVVDFAQLGLGFLRVVVATRFFWSM